MRARVALLVVAAHGCGRSGFDPIDPIDSIELCDPCLTVVPVYPEHAAWNEWVKNSNGGTSLWDQPEATCPPDQPGTHHACIHGGELRAVEVPERSSCTDLVAADELGAFEWVCSDVSGSVVFRSAGLRADARLATVLDASGASFRPNRVLVSTGGAVIARSAPSIWWDNPVRPLPANPTGPVLVLDAIDDDGAGPDEAFTPGTILTLGASRATGGYNLAEDHLALVVMPGARLNLAANTASNCNVTTGETGPVVADPVTYRPCLIAAGSQSFLWIEGALDNAPGGPSPNATALLLATVRRAVVRGLTTQNGGYGVMFHGSRSSFAYDVRVAAPSKYGFIISQSTVPSTDNVLARVFVGNTTQTGSNGYSAILLEGGATGNVLTQLVATGASQFGLLVYGPGNHRNTWSHITLANTGNGIQMVDGATTNHTTMWQVIDASSGEDGLHLGNVNNGRFAQLVLVNDFDDGIDADGTSTGTTFSSNILFGGNGLDCEGCTLPGSTRVLPGVNVASSFAGRVATASVSSIADWTDLPTPYHSWGKDAAYATAASRGQCVTGVCATWDWRLASAAPTLLGRSGDGQTLNTPFVVGAPCPDAAHGDRVITTALGVTYLLNATEIFFDGRGNEDGLCESGEACLYSPSFGAYQGEGDYRDRTCTFVPGAITGVDLFGYPISGI